jgi:hypothetical protein
VRSPARCVHNGAEVGADGLIIEEEKCLGDWLGGRVPVVRANGKGTNEDGDEVPGVSSESQNLNRGREVPPESGNSHSFHQPIIGGNATFKLLLIFNKYNAVFVHFRPFCTLFVRYNIPF